MTDRKTLLITGASGFIGSQLLRAMVRGAADELGFERVVATDIRELPDELAASAMVDFHRVDIRDRDAVVELFETCASSAVVHLAAMVTPPPGAGRQLQFDVDVRGTRHVVAGCLAAGTEQFIYTSSGAAYGYHPENATPLREDDPLRGNEAFAYAHHKRMVEEELGELRKAHPELGQLIFRVSTVLAPSTDNQITALFEQDVVTGLRGADSPFCIIAADDVVGAILHGLRTGKAGIFNLSGDGVLTLAEIAERMGGRYVALPEAGVRAALTGLSAAGLSPYGPEQTLFLKHRPVLENTKLVEEFGYRPQLTSEEAFEAYRQARRDDEAARVVLLTGAGGGLGTALARWHAERGDRLVLFERDPDALERVYMMARAHGAAAVAVEGDVRSDTDCARAVDAAEQAFGGVDILYNNAGIPLRAQFTDSDVDAVGRVVDINFMGAVRMTQAALPSMRRRSGRIAVISSVAGFAPLTGRTAYAASKHALHGFFESLRTEIDDDGVSVTLACPTYISTAFRKDARDQADELDVGEAARQICEAVEKRQRMAFVGGTARLAWWARHLAPGLYDRLMRYSVREEFG